MTKIKEADRQTITEAAQELGVALSTLKDWIENGYPRRVKLLKSERIHSNRYVSRRQIKKLKAEREQESGEK